MLVNRSHSAKIGFGYKLAIDSGASDPRKGSLKITIFKNNGDKLISSCGIEKFHTKVCPNGIKSSNDYINGLKARIEDFINNNKVKNKLKELIGNDKKLKGIALFVPGATVNNKAKVLPNLKDENNKPLKDVNFNEVKNVKGVDKANEFNLLALNDMAGATAYVAKTLASQEGRIYSGLKATVCMTGGGCGVSSLKVVNGDSKNPDAPDDIIVVTTELGHVRGLKNEGSVEKEGASVPALISNYAEALRLDQSKINTLLGLGNAKLVTQYPLILDKKSNEAQNLIKTKLFNEKKAQDDKVKLTLKNVTQEQHNKASNNAVNVYLDAVAQIAQIEAAKGTNEFILTGPLVGGVKKVTKKMGMNFDEEVKKRAINLLGPGGKAMADSNDFKVSSDINIPDNTLGGPILLDGDFVSKRRGNCVRISTASLNNK